MSVARWPFATPARVGTRREEVEKKRAADEEEDAARKKAVDEDRAEKTLELFRRAKGKTSQEHEEMLQQFNDEFKYTTPPQPKRIRSESLVPEGQSGSEMHNHAKAQALPAGERRAHLSPRVLHLEEDAFDAFGN
jgi:hypothetical protein